MRTILLFTSIIFLTLCSVGPAKAVGTATRWYSSAQVDLGRSLFQSNCAGCHGAEAQGVVVDWKRPLPGGSYPPPPLNGSAHAWHHPLSNLKHTVGEGSMDRGGKMPGFKSILSDQDQLAVIAFFQNFWDDRVYMAWLNRGGLSK